jgi:hypothetical protein
MSLSLQYIFHFAELDLATQSFTADEPTKGNTTIDDSATNQFSPEELAGKLNVQFF